MIVSFIRTYHLFYETQGRKYSCHGYTLYVFQAVYIELYYTLQKMDVNM